MAAECDDGGAEQGAAVEVEGDSVGAGKPEAPTGKAEDGAVLSVLVKSVDKLTTDSDLIAHFSAPDGSGVVRVEQFSNPKHTARIDLVDAEGVSRALQLHGAPLQRRDLVVEPWDDAVFANMKPYERKLAAVPSSGVRQRLNIKPRTIPVDVHTGDPHENWQSQRSRREPTQADADENWRSRPACEDTPAESPSLSERLMACCRRRR